MKFWAAFGASVVKRSTSMSPFSVAIVALVMGILLEGGLLRGADGDLVHGDGMRRKLGVGGRGNRVGDRHPGGHRPDDLVRVVRRERTLGLVAEDDEELRPDGIRRRRAGHGHGGPSVDGCHWLVLDRVTGAARTRSGGIATLDDEVRDDAMEDDAIVETAAGKGYEVAGRDRREVGVDRDLDLARGRFDRDEPLLACRQGWRLGRGAGPGRGSGASRRRRWHAGRRRRGPRCRRRRRNGSGRQAGPAAAGRTTRHDRGADDKGDEGDGITGHAAASRAAENSIAPDSRACPRMMPAIPTSRRRWIPSMSATPPAIRKSASLLATSRPRDVMSGSLPPCDRTNRRTPRPVSSSTRAGNVGGEGLRHG